MGAEPLQRTDRVGDHLYSLLVGQPRRCSHCCRRHGRSQIGSTMNARTIALSAVTAVLAGCAAHGSGATNVLPQDAARLAPAAASTRGQIISIKRVTLITKKEMEAGVINGVVTQISGKPKCDVVLYAVRYDTIGVKGEATDASAAFMVPDKSCGAGPFPLVGYAHGTNVAKNQLITDPSTSNPN